MEMRKLHQRLMALLDVLLGIVKGLLEVNYSWIQNVGRSTWHEQQIIAICRQLCTMSDGNNPDVAPKLQALKEAMGE